MNFWTIPKLFPPFLCRLLARHPGPGGRHHPVPMSYDDIVKRSGMTLLKAVCISESMSWDGIPVDEMEKFTNACGIDFGNADQMKRLRAYLRSRHRFTYLRKSDQWQTLKPLILKWQEALKKI